MNILFISIAWPSSGERNLYTDLMEEFVRKGNNVWVVASSSSGISSDSTVNTEKGINILRVESGKIRKTSHIKKALSLLMLNRRFIKEINRSLGNMEFNLIIGHTPPITLSRLYLKLKRKYNTPFYLLLKDIWPQGSVDLNVLRRYNLPWLWLRAHEKRIYKSADFIGCMSPRGKEYLLSKNSYLSSEKIEVCPNSIRPSLSWPEKSREIRKKYKIPEDTCVFIFSGNLGIGHGLSFLVEAIKHLEGYRKAFFIIGGSGTQFQFLQNSLGKYAPENALLYEWLPSEDFLKMLMTSDVGLVLLYKYTVPQFPSRLLSYFDYSKPVLCAVNNNTDLGNIVERNGCGISVDHGNLEEFVKAVRYFSENTDVRISMGEKGREYLLQNYTVSNSYDIIMNHFGSK